MNFPIGDVGPTTNEENEPEEVQYRLADIFINFIDEEYQSNVDLNYEDQDGEDDDEEEENYEEDDYYEEDPPLSEGGQVAIEDRYEHGESSHTYRTRSLVVATIDIDTQSQREATMFLMPLREDEVDIPYPTGDIGDEI